MKTTIKYLGLLALLMMGLTATARADYSGNCAGVPTGEISGNVTITQSGTCTISHNVVATGYIHLSGTGNVNAEGFAAGDEVEISTTGGHVTITTISTSSGDATITATGNISTGTIEPVGSISISTSGGTVSTDDLDTFGYGPVTVSASGNVTIDGAVTGGTTANVLINGAAIVVDGNVSSGGNIGVGWNSSLTPATSIKITGNVSSNTAGGGGNIILAANGKVATGNITTSPTPSYSGDIEIQAELGGGSSLFTVNGSGATNGVNGTITAGGGPCTSSTTQFGCGVFITNGTSSSTGGITVDASGSSSPFNVSSTTNRAGAIILNAQNGTLTLPAVPLQADGATGQMAGVVALMANTITFGSGASVSASQDSTATASDHNVVLSASTVNLSSTLSIQSNGNGLSSADLTGVWLLPQTAYGYTSNENLSELFWTGSLPNGSDGTQSPLTVTGSGDLDLSANGTGQYIQMSGYPLSFSHSGAINATANGSSDNHILITYSGTTTGVTGLDFANSGAVTLTANTDDSAAELGFVTPNIQIAYDMVATPTPSVSLVSNGSTGPGGWVQTVLTNSDLTIGTAAGDWNFSAQNPGNTTDGGYVDLQLANSGSINFDGTGTTPINVSAESGVTNADGGHILLRYLTDITSTSSGAISLNADGAGSGNGGEVHIITEGNIAVDSTDFQLSASGNGGGTGNGGSVTVESTYGTVSVDGASILANAGAGMGSTSNGGNIDIQTDASGGDITVTGTMSVSSSGGNGGTVTLYPQLANLDFPSGATVNANGGGAGNGGTIQLFPNGDLTIGSGSSSVVISASADQTSVGTGSGGQIYLEPGNNLTINGANISVAAGASTSSNGNGGIIYAQTFYSPGTLSLSGNVTANSAGSGTGGQITIDAIDALSIDSLANSILSASPQGASSTGDGGTIILTSANSDITVGSANGEVELVATGGVIDGDGGTVNITSTTGDVITDSSDSEVMISTSAQDGNGNGGTVNITAVQITMTGTLIANGQGSGSGGNVTLDVTGDTPLDLTEGQQITVEGGSTGDGGEVTLPNVGKFIVNDAVDVDGDEEDFAAAVVRSGQGIHSNSVSFTAIGGKQFINGVLCQQYYVTGGVNSAPLYFFDCANPSSATTEDEAPATWIANSTQLSSIIATLFPTYSYPHYGSTTNLYVVNSISDFETLEGVGATGCQDAAGCTLYSVDRNGVAWIDIGVAENSATSNNQLVEITAHELGHALDYYTGGTGLTVWSGNSVFSGTAPSLLQYDIADLNADTGNGAYDKGAGTNVPCSISNMAPFDGNPSVAGTVYASTGPICSGATVSGGPYANNWNVATTFSPGVLGASNAEIFAEAFSWEAYGSTEEAFDYNQYYQATADGLFLNGYFACSLAWANSAMTGTLSLPSGHCGH